MAHKQAVVETSAGRFVIDLNPELAPNHVGYFMKLAKDGTYNGTIFHRLIKYGIIQGGDPLSKDPAKAKLYGTGGVGGLGPEVSSGRRARGGGGSGLPPRRAPRGGGAVFLWVAGPGSRPGEGTLFGARA